MVSALKPGGIGVIGLAASRLFHPGDKVHEKYPNDTRLRCVNVVITGKGSRRIKNQMKLWYLVSIPEVDCECYITKKCFRVEQAPETSFESERAPCRCVVPRPVVGPGKDPAALSNIVANVGRGGLAEEEIHELHAEGIEVDDDNEPLDEGDGAPPPLAPYNQPHNFTVPTHCPRRERNLTDDRGNWANHRWDEIASYNELELFRMAFREEYVDRVMLPTMNVSLRNPLSLGKFYKWLGCNFFMACFHQMAYFPLK